MNSRKTSTWIVLGAAVFFIVVLIIQFIKDPGKEYARNLMQSRKEKDEFFRQSDESPLPDSLREGFTGLNYYPPDRSYQVNAAFIPSKGNERLMLAENTGEGKIYLLAGVLEFDLKGKSHRLTAFYERENDSQNLFIPFRDLTSGKTTYGGGRYLEARIVGDKALLDFNKAYHPYCVYNYSYVCPLPPEENQLNIEVEAGERN